MFGILLSLTIFLSALFYEPITSKRIMKLENPDSNTGISLAIVFDSTGSMGNDLKQVKLGSRRILRNHLKKGYKNLIKDFILVQVHDPDVGPPLKTTSPKAFNRFLDSVYTQGGGDCPEMTVTGIEMALEAARPNSLIYVFTDSSAKDYAIAPRVLDLIQKKQSQVVFVLTGYCNSTDEIGFQVYREIATISSGQVFLIKKGDIKEFMKIVESAVETLKVHILQEDSTIAGSKSYSFPVDSHVSQITVQVTNHKSDDPITVSIRDPEGRIISESNGLVRLLKNVTSAYFGSVERPLPGVWTLEVIAKSIGHSVRITGSSEVDFLPGFSTSMNAYNYQTPKQPIKGVKNYLMVNVTGNYLPGTIDWFTIVSINGSSIVRLPVNQTENQQIYSSRYPFDISKDGHFFIKVSGKDTRGYDMQRYSKIAILPRDPSPVFVSCPARLKVKRGGNLNVTCMVQSEIPYTVVWYKNNNKLPDAATDNVQFSHSSNVTYMITGANEVSQGVYACEMVPFEPKPFELKGDLRDEVDVTVLAPPPKVFVPKNSSIEPMKDAELECNVFSRNKVTIKWLKDNPRFEIKNSKRYKIEEGQKSENAFTSKLIILQTSYSDNGRYICVAEHEGGKNEAFGFVKTHTLPVVSAENKEVSFTENESISASCRAEASPTPKFSWILNGLLLESSDSRITIASTPFESQITINNAKSQDSGELICKAENSAGESEVRIKAVYMSRPVVRSLDPAKNIPVEGDQQNVRCVAEGIPPPRITWEFNGSPVTSDGNIVINETYGTLDINRVERFMKGQWTCVATNKAGVTRKSFMLEIGFPPKIEFFPNNVNANYGENLTLKCNVLGQPLPSVKWYRSVQGTEYIPIAYGSRYFLQADNSLLIKDLATEDQSTYKCEAQNMHGKVEETTQVTLTGIVAPKIAFTQSQQVSVEGSMKKVITCLVVESKPPAQISWLKNGKEIELSSRVIMKENSLVIKNVKTEDEGVYTCIAKNQIGTAKFDINLDVQTKPIITGDLKTFIDTSEGKKIVLNCQTKGDPKPKIQWKKGGRPLAMEPGSSFVLSPDGSELTVYSVVEENAGTFTCTATNDHGSAVKEFKVTVKTPPLVSKEGIGEFEIGNKDSVELNCVITSGNPSPKIEWFKNGQSLSEIPGRIELAGQKNILKLYGKNADESGSYECKATNEVGEDSKLFQITVLVPPKASESKLIKIYTRDGERIILPCKIDGYPPPKKTWTWKGNVIDLKRNPLGLLNAPNESDDLLIPQMKTELQGIYVCEASNTGGTAKMMYDVIILESPKIIQYKEHSVFFNGNTITLTCIASGNPTPTIKWLFQGKLIPSSTPGYRIVGDSHETLIVDRAELKNGGKYTCLAENEGGSDQKDAIVTVFVPTSPDGKGGTNGKTIIAPTQILDGGNITFTCIMNSTPPAEIKWYRNDIDIFTAMQRDRFHISIDGTTLTLFNVTAKDEGKYKCMAVNIPGHWSLNFTLQVLVSPVILGKHSSKPVLNVNEETDVFIRCYADGTPVPKYYWYRDNSELVSGGRIEITEGGKVLKISKIRRSDDALYQCKARNEAGEDKRNFDVNVFIPPSIIGTSMRETPEFIRGSTANLWCNVTGYPQPTIKWEYARPPNNPPLMINNSSQLHFLAADNTHITRYICIATNEAGSSRKVFDPVLIYPPKIITRDSESKRWILKNGEMRLICNSESSPQSKTEWFKDGELIKSHARINITNRGTELNLFNALETDVGSYKCLVTNKLGQDKQSWTLDIMTPPTIRFSSLPGKHQVALGGTLYIFCIPDGRPKPKLQWTKDGSVVDIKRATLSEDGYHLAINVTQESDMGRYQCTAENIHGQSDRSFDVEITYGPTLDPGAKRYYKIDRTVGGTVVLECLVSGNPLPTIVWYKDGIPINRMPSFRYRMIGNKQLEIISMQGDDAGRYSCVSKNTFGQLEVFMDLTVGAPPTIERSRTRSEFLIKVGDELTLHCPVTGSPKPKIMFSKEGKPISSDGSSFSRDNFITKRIVVSQERQTLTLTGVQRSDSGLYQCNASNPVGYDIMDYVIKVRAPPKFDTSNVETEAYWYLNQTRSLECVLMGIADPPAKISWERHGSPVHSGGSIRIAPDGTKLTVENVQQFDAGEYRCYAENEVAKISLTFQVLVYVKPRFLNGGETQVIEAVQNKTIQLSCEATGQPRPRFSWYRQDREIFSGQETYSNIAIIRGEQVLQISNIQEYDTDVYSCTASNGGGTIEKKFKISVILPPRIMKRTLGPENYRIKESTPITLHCNVYNFNTTRPVMSWSKDGSPILLGESDYFVTHNNVQSLTIMNPTIDEAGRYTCDAENIAGRDSHTFVLTVVSPPKFPPDFSKFKEVITVQLGSSVNFQCPADGAPPPTIIWFNRDIPISPFDMVNYVLSNNGKLLTIPSVGKEGGLFRCLARNEAGSISKVYQLDVTMPPLVRLDKVDIRERAGSTFSVHCTAEGFPKPSLLWTRDGKGLFRLGTKADLTTGILTISDSREEDSGRYTCSAKNKVSTDSKSVDVTIISPPKIEPPRKSILVRLGEQVLLPCIVEGTRPIRVHWYTSNNAQISSTIVGEYRFLPDQGLIIERVRKDHAGVYRCIANNDAGYQEIRVTLDILIPPKISRPTDTDITGILNSVLQIQCKVIEGLPSPSIIWERNGVALSKLKTYYTATDSGLFIFNSLKNEDEGSLTCVAVNSAGEDRLTFQINVELLPKVTLPMSVTGDEGSSVTITCRVEGKPKPSVTWRKEGLSLVNVLGNRFRFNSENEIYILSLKPEDAGNYNCIGERTGAETSTASTYLTIFTRPKLYNTPKPRNIVQEGRWIIFRCEANSHPKPDIKWMFNGRMLEGRTNHNGRGSLALGPLASENAGEYRCIAKNRVGSVEFQFMLEVISRPKVTVYQSDEPVVRKNMTTLICKIEGKVDTILWLKNGLPVHNSSKFHITDHNLVINNAESADTGTYQCIASNSAGEAQGQVTVLVKSQPRLTLRPENTTISLGNVLVMHCAADGYPVPSISWYRNGRKIEMEFEKSLIRNGSLRIIGVQKEHEGIYFCVANNNIGEAHSQAAFVVVQIPGGWSQWTQWSKCSVSCGNGYMSRKRRCDNPPPSNQGPECIGEDIEHTPCFLRFCPTDGGWSEWQSWSQCSSSCGSGMRQRTRRCDNPPPSNLGKPCLGEALEDIFCEKNPPCPIDGSWSEWSAWSVCSVPCGTGGSQRRERSCDNPVPSHGGIHCNGKDVEVKACSRGACPVNGGWSQWSRWSYCSKSCGNGFKQRTRRCDSPTPKFGGNDCFGSSSDKINCNEQPCPVHGGWSNWASWSACSVDCGGGIQSRDRMCTEPPPSLGGQWCRGSLKEVRRCNEYKCAINNKHKWSEWSGWTACSTDCIDDQGQRPVKKRYRRCMSASSSCVGEPVEVADCTGLTKCQELPKKYNSFGEIRGFMNKEDVGIIPVNVSWNSDNIKKTLFQFNLSKIQPAHMACLTVLTGILTPVLWHEAYEVGLANNGRRIANGNFEMKSRVEFADGNSVAMRHMFVTRSGVPGLLTVVNGSCSVATSGQGIKTITLEKYKEVIVQLNPALGRLHADSSRFFKLNNEIEPYHWSTSISVPADKRQHFLVQQMLVQDLSFKADTAKGTLNISLSCLIAEEDNSKSCPTGFSLVNGKAYCEDVNECKTTVMNKCDQICENTVPGFRCHCQTGFRLGGDGRSCYDIDECSEKQNVCADNSYECVNMPGSFVCRSKCGSGYRRSTNDNKCEDINECVENPGICGTGHQCANTLGSYHCICQKGYRRYGKQCTDIDECSLGFVRCQLNQVCRNLPGSYYCETVCNKGFQLVSGRCVDIDECVMGFANCSGGSKCSNLLGSFRCDCDPGFQIVDNKCVDVDECKLSPSPCKFGCRNIQGSYECLCPSNMIPSRDRKSCLSDKTQTCKEGFTWNSSKGCVDINECDPRSPSNVCQYRCVNTYGSYKCQCPEGYTVSVQNNKCIDVNECSIDRNLCPRETLCINTPGNYSCIAPRCPQGYRYLREYSACVLCDEKSEKCIPHPKAPKIKFIVVQLAGSKSQPVEVRVINTLNQKEDNCEYRERERSKDIPVTYESFNGSILIKPSWSEFSDAIFKSQPYYLLFDVTCWSSIDKRHQIFQNAFYIYVTLSKYHF